MSRVLFLLVAESFAFTLLCLPAVLLMFKAHGGVRISLRRIAGAAALLLAALLILDLAGTYLYRSSFTGLFTTAQYLWFIALSYFLAGRLMRLFANPKNDDS